MSPELAGRLTQWALGPHPLLDVVLLPAVLLLALVFLLALWVIQSARLALVLTLGGAALLWLRERARGPLREGRGGHSPEYEAVLRSAGWRRRRSRAIRAAGRRCQECGAAGPLDVHHLTYARLGRELPADVVALCPACHRRAHSR